MRIYAGTYQGQITIIEGLPTSINLRTSKQISENSIRALAYSQGQLIAGGYDQEVRTIHLLNGTEERESKENQGIVNCITEINKELTAIGLDNGNIRFWDTNNWKCRKNVRQHKKGITDIKVDAKGVLMVSVAGKEMNLWEIKTLKSIYHYKFDFEIEHVLLVQSFEYLFLLGDRTIRQMNTTENKELFRLDITEKIQCGFIFLDFLLIATEKGEIKIWKHGHYDHCIHFKAHEGRIKGMKAAKVDGLEYLVTAEANGEVKVWDILTFLEGVDAISQDYSLQGLKALSTIKIKQRIISLQVIPIQAPTKEKEQEEQKDVKQVTKTEQKLKKKKKIHKQQKKEGKQTKP